MLYANGTQFPDDVLRNMTDSQLQAAGLLPATGDIFGGSNDNQAAIFGPLNGNLNGSGIPGTQSLQDITPPSGSWGAGFEDWFNNSPIGKTIAAGQSAASGVSSTVNSVSSFLSAISNVSRDATVVLGLILIIAGIFALTRKEGVVNVVNTLDRLTPASSRGSTES